MPKKILVVDDHEATQILLREIITDNSFEVILASSGKEAIEIAKVQIPDLILLDVMMPEMDGYETCEKMKSIRELHSIPVIFISALGKPIDKVKAFEVGGVDYVTKPLSELELVSRIRTHVKMNSMRKNLLKVNRELANKVQLYKEEIIHRNEVEKKLKETEMQVLNLVIAAEERERTKIAQEIHDGLGPILSAVKLYVQWLGKPDSPADKNMVLQKTEKLLEDAHATVKEISNNLSPYIIQTFGLTEALKNFIEKINFVNKIEVRLTSELEERLDITTEIILYRAITETINNTIKHAQAAEIKISIFNRPEILLIEYSDNGIGFDLVEVLADKKGLGLINMKNRLASIHAEMVIETQIGDGMKMKIKLPKN